MHPATPLIPAIWSSSKHAGDVKIPHLDVGEQQAPRIKMVGVRRRKEGEECRSVARRRVGAIRGCDAEGRQQHVSFTHPGSIVIDLFFSRSLAITIHKTWGAGGVGYLHTSIRAAIWHYFTSSEEMPIALLICLLPTSWPLLYVFDEGLPITCPFLILI